MPPVGPLWDAGNPMALAADCERMTSYSEAIEEVEEQGYNAVDNLSITKHRHMFD